MKIILILIALIPIKLHATSSIINIDKLNIVEIQENIDKGYLTYETLTKIYLERIEKYNEQYNAIITINQNAIAEAKLLDEEYKKSGRRSLMHGMPIIVKDNIDVKGLPTTNGTKALLDSYPYENAPIIQKLIDAGAIVLAKANMDEFAFHAEHSSSSFGMVKNAYNLEYSSYGSSGGTAVGVAAGLAVAGIGTDTGSSIRIPASANNLVGLRPTTSLIDNKGIIKFEVTRDVDGPITKYVIDNAIMLEIINNQGKKYTNFNKDISEIKIGVFKDQYNGATSFIKDLMSKQIEKLKSLGATVEFVNSFSPNYQFNANTLCYEFNEYLKGTTSKIKSLNDLIKTKEYTHHIEGYNNSYCNYDYSKTQAFKNYLGNRNNNINYVNNKFGDYDAFIYPTIKNEVVKLTNINNYKVKTFSSSIAPLVGFPAISIPIGFYNNLPYGMEILAKANNEEILYIIAYNLEKDNNFYEQPEIAPSLYTINNNIPILLNYYENSNEEKFEEIKKKTKTFLDNYNDIDDKDETIELLIKEYEETTTIDLPTKELSTNNSKEKYRIIAIYIFIDIIILLAVLIKRRCKNEIK